MDEERCPDGVILMPEGEKQPRCVPCKDVDMQQPMNSYEGLRARRADKELNATYQELMKDFPDHVPELRTAEHAWMKSRDEEYQGKGEAIRRAVDGAPVYGDCVSRRTREKDRRLKKLRERWSPR